MKKSTIILLICAFIVCLGLVGVTGYYIGSKAQKPVQQTTTETANEEATEALKAQLKEEVKEEVRAELYDEVYEEAYNAAYTTIEDDLDAKIKELQEEVKASEEEEKATETTEVAESPKKDTKPTNGNNVGGGEHKPANTERPVVQAYIHVHDVTAAAGGGTAAIEAALNSAVDSSSGIVTSNTISITGIGTFPVYWTDTDGATATSYITITE